MTKEPTKKRPARTSRKKKAPRRKNRALVPAPRAREENPHTERPPHVGTAKPRIASLPGDLPSVTLKDEHEVFAYFNRLDPCLAEAWKRDVVVHEGPITLRRIMHPTSFGGATHYACVDRRLLWYLSHDPADPIGARWDGYLANPRDAPPGTTVVFIGSNIVAKKRPPQLGEGNRS
jgi:hypothetical protein